MENNPTQPAAPVAQPTMPAAQPTMPAANDANTNITPEKKTNKKTAIIVGCIVGGLAVCGIAIALVLIFLKGGEKIVSCTQKQSISGINMEATTNVKVTDGKLLEADMTTVVDLASMGSLFKSYESMFVENILEGLEQQCDDGCEISHTYAEGDKLTVVMKATNSDGMGSFVRAYGDLNGQSAQEIADAIQESLEKTGSDVVCEQR